MTKVLSIKQIQNKEFADITQFDSKVKMLQSRLTDLYNRNLIQGATNYGSFLNNNQTALSDIDAVILSNCQPKLIQDQIFQQICTAFNQSQIDFSIIKSILIFMIDHKVFRCIHNNPVH